jgi:hypothetical protein
MSLEFEGESKRWRVQIGAADHNDADGPVECGIH